MSIPPSATTFAAARAENYQNVFLNTAQFARQVTYLPKNGGAQFKIPVSMRVRREPREDQAGNVFDYEYAEVTIALDPSGVSGLPAEPERGDAFRLTNTGEAADKGWAYGGRMLHSTDHNWTCEFHRTDLVQAGNLKSV